MSLDETLGSLPTTPGVYLMKDSSGEVIYVGKAVNLRNRVRQYFQSSKNHSPKVARMVENIADIDYIVTGSELEALVLECNLIKERRPHYNVKLRDDKTYPFIRVTVADPFPRVFMTRRVVRDGSRYFGPFTDVNAVRETLRIIKTVFPIRQCSKVIGANDRAPRPCLNYHIKRCLGPCAGLVTADDYWEVVNEVTLFLEGRQNDLISSLRNRMEAAAQSLNYEQAAVYRDQLQAVQKIVERQRVVSDSGADQDVIALARDPWGACAQVMFIRDGKLVGNDHFILGEAEGSDDSEIIASFIKEYYSQSASIPPEILAQAELEDAEAYEQWLSGKLGRSVNIRTPQRGEKRRLVELAATNAREYLDRVRASEQADERSRAGALAELAAYLGLDAAPGRIECYDISNLQGTEAVGSMVVFEQGKPAKSQYRRFRIRTVEGQNDFAMMAEVIRRRISRGTGRAANRGADGDPDPKFARLPDLMVIDGGKGQLHAVGEVLDSMGFGEWPAVGLAKREEEIFRRGESAPLLLPRDSKALHLIQHIRDEAHRFAVAYHRSLRGKSGITSELTGVPGVGKKRLVALMRQFGSLDALSRASVEEIVAAPGMNAPVAARVYEHLHPEPSTLQAERSSAEAQMVADRVNAPQKSVASTGQGEEEVQG
ncbi:MAG: excinuclease ABC subunit UvrC [Clostridia bacterium]|nr:excinuclease ABC subunit UvrC [Clostridia bacterium]